MENLDRQSLVNCGLVKEYSRGRFASYKLNDRSLLDEMEDRLGLDVVDACRKVVNQRQERVKRCRLKISDIVTTNKAHFLTLTFRNEVLEQTSPETRRRYVARALKKYCKTYVANIDFGDKEKNPESNEREHYHAIVDLTDLEGLKAHWSKEFGFIKIKRMGFDLKDVSKTTKYINKWGGHCFKDCTHMHRLIYSRKPKRMAL